METSAWILPFHGFFLINLYVDEHLEMGGGLIALADVIYAFGAILAGIFIRKIWNTKSAKPQMVALFGPC